MGPEAIDDLERELRQSLERRPAPPSLKRKVMERRRRELDERAHKRLVFWRRLTAAVTLAVVIAAVLVWRNADQRRRGEEARRQVLTALRITSRALNRMEAQLAASNSNSQE
ncbi:MAG: hypothetical protein ACRD3N_01015 [Terracidiphilus sp.]